MPKRSPPRGRSGAGSWPKWTPDPNAKEGRYDALLKAGDAISASAPCSRGRPTINRSHPFSIILRVPLRGTLSSSICLFFLIRAGVIEDRYRLHLIGLYRDGKPALVVIQGDEGLLIQTGPADGLKRPLPLEGSGGLFGRGIEEAEDDPAVVLAPLDGAQYGVIVRLVQQAVLLRRGHGGGMELDRIKGHLVIGAKGRQEQLG